MSPQQRGKGAIDGHRQRGGFPTFSKFIDSVSAAKHEEYSTRSAAKVQQASEFDAMRGHILGLYEGVEVQQ